MIFKENFKALEPKSMHYDTKSIDLKDFVIFEVNIFVILKRLKRLNE